MIAVLINTEMLVTVVTIIYGIFIFAIAMHYITKLWMRMMKKHL